MELFSAVILSGEASLVKLMTLSMIEGLSADVMYLELEAILLLMIDSGAYVGNTTEEPWLSAMDS
jgi:hypothetical protein